MNKPIHLSTDHAKAIMYLLDEYALACVKNDLGVNHIYVTNMAAVLQEAIEDSEKES